jgi:hypothetical protein
MFENRVLRRIFGLKGDDVTGGWRKVHNEELHNLLLFMKYENGHIKSDLSRACSTRGREGECIQCSGGKVRTKETTREI